MGTEVLRAQDPLQRMRFAGHAAPVLSPAVRRNRSDFQNPNPRRQQHHEQHKKRENTTILKKSSYVVDDSLVLKKKNTNSNLVMGGFTLLKRGESIDESTKKKIDECLAVESVKKIESVVADRKLVESVVVDKKLVEPKKKVESVVFVDKKQRKKKIEKKNTDLIVLGGTKRIGPDPAMVPKQVKFSDLMSSSPPLFQSNGVFDRSGPKYAGSGFVTSPEPESLPLPSFSFNTMKKKEVVSVVVDDTVSVSATKDIRRMLGLDLARSI